MSHNRRENLIADIHLPSRTFNCCLRMIPTSSLWPEPLSSQSCASDNLHRWVSVCIGIHTPSLLQKLSARHGIYRYMQIPESTNRWLVFMESSRMTTIITDAPPGLVFFLSEASFSARLEVTSDRCRVKLWSLCISTNVKELPACFLRLARKYR